MSGRPKSDLLAIARAVIREEAEAVSSPAKDVIPTKAPLAPQGLIHIHDILKSGIRR